MIYKLRADRENYLNFYLDSYAIEKIIGDFFLLYEDHWADFWKKVPGTFTDDSDSNNVVKVPDITVWATQNCLALNQNAYDKLKQHLAEFGELLPIECEGTPYWLFHSTNKTGMEHVDLNQSARQVDEVDYVEMQALVFKEDSLKDQLVFQTEFSNHRNMYCTEEFKTLVDSNGLKGLYFSRDLACIDEI
ncbi:hypothetical protein [Cellvibrio sp. PSBB023]|uniref:hypothetical protein n=1 Tax=Cellvibrio sp. PSBB023 TaxID=1945512 RepID=UPI00098F1E81|nr:hypothetical protein [Cellvibrio sp. PSBB023]AQT59212.1 hypothetical protein B0D95_03245 [Cellvibrio sp. PSBB023]